MAGLWKNAPARSDLRAARRSRAYLPPASQVGMSGAMEQTVLPGCDKGT